MASFLPHIPSTLSQVRRLVFSPPANTVSVGYQSPYGLLHNISVSSLIHVILNRVCPTGTRIAVVVSVIARHFHFGQQAQPPLQLLVAAQMATLTNGGSITATTNGTSHTTNGPAVMNSSSSSTSSRTSSSNDELNHFVSEEDESVGSPAPIMEVYFPDLIMERARKMNCFFLNRERLDTCKAFIIEDFQVGLITPEVLRELERFPDVFVCDETTVKLHGSLTDYASRSEAVEQVLNELRRNDVFVTLRGWRDECYEVRVDITTRSLMRMERAATCLFGIRQFGVDINGYVNHPKLGMCLWMQRRSKTKSRWGGKLDNVVGGGLSVGFTVEQTAHKEAMEEAGIPEYILRNLQPVGTVTIFFESERGLSPNTEFVYDLEIPADFIPENQDGEVESFHLVPIKEVLPIVLSDQFKTTSLPVALDFLVRHGFIDIESDPELQLLPHLLHIPLQYFYKRYGHETETAIPPLSPLIPSTSPSSSEANDR